MPPAESDEWKACKKYINNYQLRTQQVMCVMLPGLDGVDYNQKKMKTNNATLMNMAADALKGKWLLAIGTFLVYILIMSPFSAMKTFGVLSLLIAGPMMLGAAMFSLSIARGQNARLEQIFDGFRFYSSALITHLLFLLYVILWTLLLVIPGIIAVLSYSMSFYILADDPSIKPQDALKMSKEMMDGNKMKLLGLLLLLLLLALLCVLTAGIGFLLLIPFANVTLAKFYDDIRQNR